MNGSDLLISVDFWIAFGVFAIADRSLLGLLPRRVHYFAMVVASAGFLLRFTGIGSVPLAGLLFALSAVYGAAVLAAREAPRRSVGPLVVLSVVAVLWAIGKIGVSLDLGRLSWLFVLGASFILVKLWTFLKDLGDGRIRESDLASFLAYCTFFPCFIAGPIHTYGEFQAAFERRSAPSTAAFVDHVFRILHGLVKVLIVASVLRPFSLDEIQAAGFSSVGFVELGIRSLVYSLVLYLDFSGYSDIAIGAGGLLGIRVPENFRMPYLAQDIRDFWQRWHMTFTRFLTQYLFIPIARRLQTRAGIASATLVSSSAYAVTFLFCGFWHGSTPNFLAWGAYHAIGLAVYDFHRNRRARLARARRTPLAAPSLAAKLSYTLATFLFVSCGWLLFDLPLGFWLR
jgi:D-alanyl-lipoteichoic acid acyltransferase DltB (MBOAT superfamily)